MVSRHPSIWKLLPYCAVALLLLGSFGPLPDPVDKIASGVGVALTLAYFGTLSWEERRKRQADRSSSAAISSNDQR